MRKLIGILIIAVLFISCNDKSKNQRILFDSEGRINDISVVIDNENWKGRLGEAIRNILTEPVYGLPQDEPIFNINQIPPQVFTDFITRTRTVLKIEMGKKAGMVIRDNVYAKPQKVIVIAGKTKDEIITILNENSAKIIETFRKIELAARQNQMRKALYNSKVINEKLGVSIEFPNAYRIAKEDDDFFWIRRDIRTGTLNLMLYELPYGAIKKTDSVVNKIVAIRDSIGQKYIEGPVEGSYMSTEMAYTPFHGETILDNKPTLETKGMWQVKNAFMAGPYINYAIEDKINKRWIVAEGFAFAPSVEKRDYMFELEAIIKTIEIGN
ncbi:protein of unknown function [Hyunsoonleella jejuensis]|uniref:DUF4837 domain-containing protein n=1 Tax=Hyunsoonleella jejuensis TaxID=419940 RepID=A0A1H9B1H3_9FLAO|nr:DUF4837 family protein [Hyunsoonleella jejuensis]SEP82872.1 protein of unknown function [Hyunsoonleella jejuensis]